MNPYDAPQSEQDPIPVLPPTVGELIACVISLIVSILMMVILWCIV